MIWYTRKLSFLFMAKTKKKHVRKQHSKKTNPFLILLLVAALVTGASQIFSDTSSKKERKEVPLSEIQSLYAAGGLEEVFIDKGEIRATQGDVIYVANRLPYETVSDLGFDNKDIAVPVEVYDVASSDFWDGVFKFWGPVLLIIFIFLFLMKKAGSGGGMNFGSSKAKLVLDKDSKTKFADVAGAEEAKEELMEVVDFLKHPKKYVKIGAKIPKGILMVGEPGTGKTLMARAVAGEAGVPFFSISGSEFIEMFVGVGASRVRDLFSKAKKISPSIIFIDEIDAIGKQRGKGYGGGHDEREQTLNQILTEMDGFDNESNVIVIAATNRPNVLDKALLRPGRFDRRVVIEMPNAEEREQILTVHIQGKEMAKKIDLKELSKKTPGFSGAELESVVNEAAITSARHNKKTISQEALLEAVEKVMMGPEKKSKKVLEKERQIIAYHEVGHALVSHKIDECDPVHKISIVARGGAAGLTWYLPDEESQLHSKQNLFARICGLMGGRIAEQMKFGDDAITTGASNDLERATKIAQSMVARFGMTGIGLSVFTQNDESFLGVDIHQGKNYSENTAQKIEAEVERILQKAYKIGSDILKKNNKTFEKIAQDLLAKEVINQKEFEAYFA
ncbi:cell division protein FtsH [Candidatus Peregrinibacteria bacterium]|nr:MAG: cell division protein FtsH [Candidatus Peregrinibacteria bacterium]